MCSRRGKAGRPPAAAWHVYIIRCADNSLYTGITTDLERRLREHRGGKGAKYAKGRTPLRLVWRAGAKDRACAARLEHAIKRLGKPGKERLIKGDLRLPRPNGGG